MAQNDTKIMLSSLTKEARSVAMGCSCYGNVCSWARFRPRTADYKSIRANLLAILVTTLIDIAVQINIWRPYCFW